MKKFSSVAAFKSLTVLLCLVSLVMPSNVYGQNQGESQRQGAWAEYADAKQRFKIEYPTTYQVDAPTGL